MIIISDTSVITNLLQLNEFSILENLFGRVIIPQKVYEELKKLPPQTKIIDQTDWIEIKSISNNELYTKLELILDPGEKLKQFRLR